MRSESRTSAGGGAMSEWPEGPRDWSPRLAQALREVEKLRPLIPAHLIVEQAGYYRVGNVIPVKYNNVDLLCKHFMLVAVPYGKVDRAKLSPTCNDPFQDVGIVHVYSDGFVHIDIEIYYLLTGQIGGYEHLKGSWPWADFWGPPDPTEKAAPQEVMGMEPTNSLGDCA